MPFVSYPLETTVADSPDALRQTLEVLREARIGKQPHPVAVISGGSVSGYAAALKLAALGFNVIVAEQRAHYSRMNMIGLAESAVFSLASLAPDGALLKALIQDRLVTPSRLKLLHQHGVDSRERVDRRYIDWLIPARRLPVRIPILQASPKHDSYRQDLAGHGDLPAARTRCRAAYLDLAWPQNNPRIASAAPEAWKITDITALSGNALVHGLILDIEHGLNRYCAKHPRIHIVHRAVSLAMTGVGHLARFVPTFLSDACEAHSSVTPDFPIDLICIAEGVGSANAAAVGTALPDVRLDEYWDSTLFIGSAVADCKVGVAILDADRRLTPRTAVTVFLKHRRQTVCFFAHFTAYDATTRHAVDFDCARMASRNRGMAIARERMSREGCTGTLREDGPQIDLGPVDIHIKSAKRPLRANAILIGDAATSGSPVGGSGASLAISAFPVAIARLVSHPLFRETHPKARRVLERAYRRDIADIAECRHDLARTEMRATGGYTKEVGTQIIRHLMHLRFDTPQ